MIEQDLTRIADALERIAQALSEVRVDKVLSPPERKWLTLNDSEPPTTQQAPQPDEEHLKREHIKAQLVEKGIVFKPSARTETLQKLLDAASATQATDETVAIPQEVAEALAPAAEPETVEADINMVREALVNLSTAKSKDDAIVILKEVGGTDKLSNVDPSRYAAVIKACKAAVA